MTPTELMALAKCFECGLNVHQMNAIQTYLLSQMVGTSESPVEDDYYSDPDDAAAPRQVWWGVLPIYDPDNATDGLGYPPPVSQMTEEELLVAYQWAFNSRIATKAESDGFEMEMQNVNGDAVTWPFMFIPDVWGDLVAVSGIQIRDSRFGGGTPFNCKTVVTADEPYNGGWIGYNRIANGWSHAIMTIRGLRYRAYGIGEADGVAIPLFYYDPVAPPVSGTVYDVSMFANFA